MPVLRVRLHVQIRTNSIRNLAARLSWYGNDNGVNKNNANNHNHNGGFRCSLWVCGVFLFIPGESFHGLEIGNFEICNI